MLCRFARTFPPRLAEWLGRSKTLKRRFREETATELLLMGLLGLPPSGLKVDFSDDEKTDGADMAWEADWYFVSPGDPKGGSYVRLLIQAKVAMREDKVKSPYWYYAHLDYDGGDQAKKLIAAAATAPQATLPLYMMFHPAGALGPAKGKLPAIEGINLVPAADVHAVVTQTFRSKGGKMKTGCRRKHKKVDHWRSRFFSLHDLLCWPQAGMASLPPMAEDVTQFLVGGFDPEVTPLLTPAWHPDFVARRLNELTGRNARGPSGAQAALDDRPPLEPQPIPAELRRAIDNEESEEERRALPRPRVIFSSPINRDDADYQLLSERSQPRPRRPG